MELFGPIYIISAKELTVFVRGTMIVIGCIAEIRQRFEVPVYELVDYFVVQLEHMAEGMSYNP